MKPGLWVSLAILMIAGSPAVPVGIARQLPSGYDVLSEAGITIAPNRHFVIVALGRKDEDARRRDGAPAPARPLLIFEQRGAGFTQVGRNDEIVMRTDEGGQCDPFLDGDAVIAAKGRFFTVENGVACGQHWTDYITFRFDDRAGFVFDNERMESWKLNPSDAPNAEALVPDGPQHVLRDKPGHITPFPQWRSSR